MLNLEHEMKLLEVAIYRYRPRTPAEIWNGMARRMMVDAAYVREVTGRI